MENLSAAANDMTLYHFVLYYIASVGIICVFLALLLENKLTERRLKELFVLNMKVFIFGFVAAIALNIALDGRNNNGIYTFPAGFVVGIFLVLLAHTVVSFPEFKRLDPDPFPRSDEWSRKLTFIQFLTLFIIQTTAYMCVHFGWMIYLDWEIPSW